MRHRNGFILTAGLAITLSACGSSAEIEKKLESVSQCINAPNSIQQSFDLAYSDDRIPVYVTSSNFDQYEGATWYQTSSAIYDNMTWELEDWSAISDLSECDQALTMIEVESPVSKPVKQMRSFLDFNRIIYEKYNSEQREEASFELYSILNDAQSCLLVDSYPQAFISLNYNPKDTYYPMAFSIDWDGDDFQAFTTTADGRNPLWRPIKSVETTGCLEKLKALPDGFINWATSSGDAFLLTWTEYNEYTERFEEITNVVSGYNQIVDEQHEALKALRQPIPKMGPYTPPIIHRVDIEYFSDRDFKTLLKTCHEAVPETWMNEAKGQLMATTPKACVDVENLCNTGDVNPPLDMKACAPYVAK